MPKLPHPIANISMRGATVCCTSLEKEKRVSTTYNDLPSEVFNFVSMIYKYLRQLTRVYFTSGLVVI